jgi:hypothetical protein
MIAGTLCVLGGLALLVACVVISGLGWVAALGAGVAVVFLGLGMALLRREMEG